MLMEEQEHRIDQEATEQKEQQKEKGEMPTAGLRLSGKKKKEEIQKRCRGWFNGGKI